MPYCPVLQNTGLHTIALHWTDNTLMDVLQENIILQYSAVYAGLTKFNALQGSIE